MYNSGNDIENLKRQLQLLEEIKAKNGRMTGKHGSNKDLNIDEQIKTIKNEISKLELEKKHKNDSTKPLRFVTSVPPTPPSAQPVKAAAAATPAVKATSDNKAQMKAIIEQINQQLDVVSKYNDAANAGPGGDMGGLIFKRIVQVAAVQDQLGNKDRTKELNRMREDAENARQEIVKHLENLKKLGCTEEKIKKIEAELEKVQKILEPNRAKPTR